MEKRVVLLIQLQPLLGEGLAQIFQKLEDVDLITLPCADLQKVDSCINNNHPDMILLAGEKEDDSSARLILDLLKKYEDISIVWVELQTNVLHLYTSHSLTASSAELITAIREKAPHKTEIHPIDKKKQA